MQVYKMSKKPYEGPEMELIPFQGSIITTSDLGVDTPEIDMDDDNMVSNQWSP